jgi:uncharacterized protein (DUF427 family)
MAVARWNGHVVADSDDTVIVEGNHYFPPDSVDQQLLVDSSTKTLCPWKGIAHYKTLADSDDIAPDAAWYYPRAWPLARRIRGYVAFGPPVTVEASTADR